MLSRIGLVTGSATLLLTVAGCAASAPPWDSVDSEVTQGADDGGEDSAAQGSYDSGAPSQNAYDSGPSVQAAADSGGASTEPVDDAGVDAAMPTASAYPCTGAGVAAYADALVKATRQSCTSDGLGVVKSDNYMCIQAPINQLAPPYPMASYNIINTLLAYDPGYPFLECTYFVQTITAGACGTPISPPSIAWTDYPLAYQFANTQIPGYTWIGAGQTITVKPGDIHVYKSTYQGDPGHIMIVVEAMSNTHFRVAEANELESSGQEADEETGVVSNTRIDTIDNSLLAGTFRLNGSSVGGDAGN